MLARLATWVLRSVNHNSIEGSGRLISTVFLDCCVIRVFSIVDSNSLCVHGWSLLARDATRTFAFVNQILIHRSGLLSSCDLLCYDLRVSNIKGSLCVHRWSLLEWDATTWVLGGVNLDFIHRLGLLCWDFMNVDDSLSLHWRSLITWDTTLFFGSINHDSF